MIPGFPEWSWVDRLKYTTSNVVYWERRAGTGYSMQYIWMTAHGWARTLLGLPFSRTGTKIRLICLPR